MNRFFNRPITPHLSIYKPQFSSLFSIWHRISAGFLIIYIIFFICLYKSFVILLCILNSQFFNAWYTTSIPFVLNYLFFTCLSYHFLNGFRHIVWDLGFFLTKTNVSRSSIIILLSLFSSQFLFLRNYLP